MSGKPSKAVSIGPAAVLTVAIDDLLQEVMLTDCTIDGRSEVASFFRDGPSPATMIDGGTLMTQSELTQRASDTAAAYLALGCEAFEADGARFVRNRNWPLIYDANHVSHVRCGN